MDSRLVFRMIAPTVGVAVMLSGLGGFAAWYVHQLQQETAAEQAQNVAKVKACKELVTIGHDLRHELTEYAALEDRRHLEIVLGEQEKAEGHFCPGDRGRIWISGCAAVANSLLLEISLWCEEADS